MLQPPPFHYRVISRIALAILLFLMSALAVALNNQQVQAVTDIVRNGSVDSLKVYLSSSEVTPQERTSIESLLFKEAIEKDKVDLVTYFIANGRSVDEKDSDGITPLMRASYFGALDVAKFLVAQGANINETKGRGLTPIMYAAAGGRVSVVELLIAHGARLDANIDGQSAMSAAAENAHLA